jgi:hypothetical protein
MPLRCVRGDRLEEERKRNQRRKKNEEEEKNEEKEEIRFKEGAMGERLVEEEEEIPRAGR